ncbi:MAG: apolipoprotein N-acyltransferase [Stenomitos rutilans HA7619-LM2]|nr:apolipoprotein N-acyltransferase [Stenomitos rutilans HA7619-LM2]
MGLAPAPLNLFPLAWVALVPLWLMLFKGERSTTQSMPLARSKDSACRLPLVVWLSLAWGFGYHGLALSWIRGLHPLTWLGVPWLASVAIVLFCWGFITLWGAVLVALWSLLMLWAERLTHRTQTPPLWTACRRVLLGTALWCSLEWLWSLGPLDWTVLAYTQSPGNLPLLHVGQLSGTSGITAAIVAVNGLLAEGWMSYQRLAVSHQPSATSKAKLATATLLLLAIVLLVTVHGLGYALYRQPLASGNVEPLRVGIIQGNVPTRIKLGSEGIQRATDGYTSGYQTLAAQGVEAVLTPEGALPFLWNEPNKRRSPLYQAVLKRRIVLWLGTFTTQKEGVARSLLTIAADGSTLSRYNKIKLVPLGEYIPFQRVLGNIISILSPIAENGAPGTFYQQFETPFGRAIASICYDSAFPEVFRAQAAAGGQFILTASNLDPYSEILMAQHQAQDIMRAIETDRWAVRATNTGYSSIVTPHGNVEWRSQPHRYQIHAATIFRRQTQTLYVRWGDWLTPVLVGLGAIAVGFSQRLG